MTKQEFETRIGKQVTEEEYEAVEKVYLALPLMNKDDFSKNWKKVGNNPIVFELSEYVWKLLRQIVELKETKEKIKINLINSIKNL